MIIIKEIAANRKNIIAFAIILSVSAVLAYNYYSRVASPHFIGRFELHNQIVNGIGPSPYRYRILLPILNDFFIKVLSIFLETKKSFLLSYAISDFLAIFFLLYSLYLYLKLWFSNKESIIGILFVASTMPIVFRNHAYQPWSFLEVGLFSMSLLLIYRSRYKSLCLLIAVATLNRSTSIIIPLAFLFTNIDKFKLFRRENKIQWKYIFLFFIYISIWALIFLGIRYLLGSGDQIHTLKEIFERNLKVRYLVFAAIHISLFLGCFWLFVVFGFRNADEFIKRTTLIIPLYILIIMIWGNWLEVRLLMTLYPILIPLGLYGLSPKI